MMDMFDYDQIRTHLEMQEQIRMQKRMRQIAMSGISDGLGGLNARALGIAQAPHYATETETQPNKLLLLEDI